jgi:hypothetical protein
MSSTKSREVIWGGRIGAAKINAESARERAKEAAREADSAQCYAWSLRMEAFGGLAQHVRQEAAHALLNTSSLLEHGAKISTQLRVLNILAFASVCLLGAIVIRLYPQSLSGLH